MLQEYCVPIYCMLSDIAKLWYNCCSFLKILYQELPWQAKMFIMMSMLLLDLTHSGKDRGRQTLKSIAKEFTGQALPQILSWILV